MKNESKLEESGHVEYLPLVQHWRALLDAQVHFNDMSIRTRSVGVTITLGTYGAAGMSIIQFPDKFIRVGNEPWLHISATIVIFGLFLLVSTFLLDYKYYYAMLLAAVTCSEKLETELERSLREAELPPFPQAFAL
ncbi:MAG: hypothetical protein H0W76_24165 [Pyrinomonadaceae bacterium]|nr:hypothetical protein [Pyrinomonadaceae bacterium]